MGVVYEAEQRDPKRNVALKVIRGGRYVDDQAIRLFQREARSLARLKHHGIASIYQAGRTDDGQPFFAMELVQGIPLDEFLRSHPLEGPDIRAQIKKRLGIFLELCEAINYAHQRGVIHRDLKPSNIMVVSGPELGPSLQAAHPAPMVKVLDFGLARITDPEEAGATALTQVGQIRGSLPYMSPEQARGDTDEIDLRTDVYSLGVILYELLTDHPPYETEGLMIHEAVRAILEESPHKPSTYCHILRGDLETIVLKALEKDPADRYQNVHALGSDIERFLADQPILARPPSAGYQLRKLVARHKTAFGFAAVLFVLLAGFAITMSVMFEVQRRARQEAVLETKKAEEINTFLQQMLSSIDPQKARGREVTVREVLDEAARKVDTGLAGEPDVAAAIRSTIGATYMALGRYDDAEAHLRWALATRERILGENDPEVASSLNDLAALLWRKASYDEATPLFQRALGLQRRLLGNENTEVATSLNDLSLLFKDRGRYAQAESLCREALDIRRRILGDESPDVAVSLSNLSSILVAQGKATEAEPFSRNSLALYRSLYGNRHPDVALSLNNLAVILQEQGRYADAETLMREALDTGKAMLGPDHPSIASGLNNLAMLLTYEGKYPEAETLYREALEVYRKQLGNEHPYVASTLNNLGNVLQTEGRNAEAEVLYRQAVAMRRRLLGDEHPAVATSLNNLASVLQDQGRLVEAEALYREALSMRRKLLGNNHPHVSNSLLGLGILLLEKHDPVAAGPLLRECLSSRMSSRSRGDWQIAAAKSALGECLTMRRDYVDAESLLVEGERILSSSTAASLRLKRQALGRVIRFYEARGEPQKAATYRERLNHLER